MFDGFNDGLMDGGGSMEMERLRKLLAASRAMEEPQSPLEAPPPAAPPPAPEPQRPQQQAAPPVPDAAPIPTPAKIGMKFSFNPHSDKAEQYKDIVREYQGNRMSGEGGAGTYKDPSGLTRNLPQVYGQEGTPADPNEGPRTPEETAEELNRIETSNEGGVGGLEKQRKQHTLGYGLGFGAKNEARRKHYDEYVQRSRASDEQRREAQRQRVAARGGQMTGGGTMGSYDNSGPSVSRQGGITILRGAGRYRPADSMEQAEIAQKNASAARGGSSDDSPLDYAKFGLAQEREKRIREQGASYQAMRQNMFNQGLKLKQETAEAVTTNNQGKKDVLLNTIRQRMLQVAQVLKIKMAKAAESGLFTSPDPGRLNASVDLKTKEVGDAVPGDWDMWKDSFKTDYDLLQQLGAEGVPPEIDEVYQKIDAMSAN